MKVFSDKPLIDSGVDTAGVKLYHNQVDLDNNYSPAVQFLTL